MMLVIIWNVFMWVIFGFATKISKLFSSSKSVIFIAISVFPIAVFRLKGKNRKALPQSLQKGICTSRNYPEMGSSRILRREKSIRNTHSTVYPSSIPTERDIKMERARCKPNSFWCKLIIYRSSYIFVRRTDFLPGLIVGRIIPCFIESNPPTFLIDTPISQCPFRQRDRINRPFSDINQQGVVLNKESGCSSSGRSSFLLIIVMLYSFKINVTYVKPYVFQCFRSRPTEGFIRYGFVGRYFSNACRVSFPGWYLWVCRYSVP